MIRAVLLDLLPYSGRGMSLRENNRHTKLQGSFILQVHGALGLISSGQLEAPFSLGQSEASLC